MPAPRNDQLTAIVLTFNSEKTIPYLLRVLQLLDARIVVVDSFSTDRTEAIARGFGAEFATHPFENYSLQRKWAESFACVPDGEWVLHVDSDEIPDEELAEKIRKVVQVNDPSIDGYLLRRITYFWGRPMRHGHMNPNWHLRLYRSGRGICEDRLYDQHFVTHGPTRKLEGHLADLQLVSLTSWTASHNRWSDAEAAEALSNRESSDSAKRLKANLRGDLREKKRWIKENLWYRLPLFVRPTILFFYNYILRGGFLDGKEGLVYHTLHAFWFRFLVDAKMLEIQRFQGFAKGAIDETWVRNQGIELGSSVDREIQISVPQVAKAVPGNRN